jgi:Flp pilus assembly protein TadD
MDRSDPHKGLGQALLGKGQLDEAIAEYREAVRLNERDPLAHYDLAVALCTKGDVGAAIAEYHEAIRLKKDYLQAHNNLGSILRDKGKTEGDSPLSSLNHWAPVRREAVRVHFRWLPRPASLISPASR